MNLRIPADTLARWRAAASEIGVDVSQLVRDAVDAYLDSDTAAVYATLGRDVARLVKQRDL